jgi:hypothetical protein
LDLFDLYPLQKESSSMKRSVTLIVAGLAAAAACALGAGAPSVLAAAPAAVHPATCFEQCPHE